ncbi:MAG: hypothetical protein MJZ04_00385 [Bacteroidales bacterium]|nr:hypothetical protein [Bacteroidales bacterium]
MTAWWTSLDLMMKILWGITIASSLIFVIQTVMTFLGADAGDFDVNSADIPGDLGADIPDGAPTDFGPGEAAGTDGMSLYTFRNFVNFFLGFGWTAVLLRDSISSTALLLLLAVAVGVALVAAVMYMFKWLSGMQQSGNINVFKSAVGCQGKVYLTIPGERQGTGKVQITINNSVREYSAITDGETLKTGTDIRVVEVINASTMLVEPLNSLII